VRTRLFHPKSLRLLVGLAISLCTACSAAKAAAPTLPTAVPMLATHRATPQRIASAPAQADSAALPPVLLSTTPTNSAQWNGEPVSFTFDQPLAAESAASLLIEPRLAGETTVDGATLTFTPSAALKAGTRYQFTIDADATSATGIALSGLAELVLTATTPLQVTSTQPSAGADEVDTDSQLVIVFNRPVVPMTGIDEQAGLPQPLTIEPVVEGTGQWLNTSVYTFQPAPGWAGATTYRVSVDNLTGLSGETLVEPVNFAFTTAAPIVIDARPAGLGGDVPATQPIRPDAALQVMFSQPMDADSTAAALSISQTAADEAIEGKIRWDAPGKTLTFTPTAALEFGATYTLTVETDAQPASRQGNLRERFTRAFTVIALPAVTNTTPADEATNVPPEQDVIIRFTAPVSPSLVLANIQITPLLTTTQVYSYYSDYNTEATLSWDKQPQTAYTVTVGGAIADEYGNTLGEDTVVQFTTGDYTPYARINLERFTHFSAYTQTHVALYYRNMPSLDVALYQLPTDELFRLTGRDQYQAWENYEVPDPDVNRIWSQQFAPNVDPNITGSQVISLTNEAGERLAPGIYLLEVAPPQKAVDDEQPNPPSQALIVLSDYNLVLKKSLQGNSLAWLTDLRTGEPVAEQPIQFYDNGKQLAEGTTDANGIALSTLELDPNATWAPVLAISGEPGKANFATVSSEWNSGVTVWDFGLSGGYTEQQTMLHFYTDRPIYRPGQTVYWKGIIRLLEDDQYSIPGSDRPIHIVVRDDRGNTVQEGDFTLNAQGTLNGQIELALEAVTGFYYIEASLATGPEQTVTGGAGFQVAAYRKPEFQITVTADKPEYVQGDMVRVAAQANYFSGGGLGNAPVTWRLIADPYSFNWAQSPTDRFFSFTPYDPQQDDYDPYNGSFIGLRQEGEGTTAADGSFMIEVPADLRDALQSQTWMIEATIQSSTNEFVSASVSVPVHRSEFYLGISPQSYVVQTGQESTVDLVTVTPQGEPFPAVDVGVTVYEFEWNSVYMRSADSSYRWENSVIRTPVVTTTATANADGTATISWTPTKGGQYQMVASSPDAAGVVVSSAAYVWVSAPDADDFVAWPRADNDRIELVADKPLYAPGDTAKILVPSPFEGSVNALFTLERGGVIESRFITLTGNSETLEISITAEHIPNIFVSVVIVKGVDKTNPTPAIRVGLVQLAVDTSQKALHVGITPTASAVQPGDTISYTLTVTDYMGAPVENAEVSVALIDKAVLTLAYSDPRTLLDLFYYERPLGVTTSALLVINRDRLSQLLSEGAKGGGGGGGDASRAETRDDFPDVAYWRADLTTDAEGKIAFAVKLPDNLTTWVLVAKGVTADTWVGEASHEVVASKELQVRPRLPRFFTAGDQAQIGATVINASQQALDDLTLTVTLRGAQSDGRDTATFTAPLAAGGQASFTLPISVDALASNVIVTFTAHSATLDDLDDTVRISLPVVRYTTPETVSTAGSVAVDGQLEAVRVPADATENGELEVTIEPSLAAGMLAGLDYLAHYPYEGNEQTISRFLPNLFTVRALRMVGIDTPELESELAAQVGIGVQRLVNRQNQDGGWGFWPGEASNSFITSYVLWGLTNAVELEFSVPQRTISEAATYLNNHFTAPKDITENWRLNEMAFVLFVLAESGQGDPGRASTLYDERERLDQYGRAYLAMALDRIAKADAASQPDERVNVLLDGLFASAQLSATGASWHEAMTDYQNMNTDTRTTSIVLAAFVRIEPDQPLLADVVRWLMSARRAGRWETTQENAWAIMALSEWMTQGTAGRGELEADYDWSVTLNDQALGSGAVNADNLTVRVQLRAAVADLLRNAANALRFTRSTAAGQLYYTAHLRYYQDALAVEAQDRGLVIDRRFALDGETVSSAAVGDVISVTVTLVAPTDLHYALIEAPIPAGTEPIDPNLATTSAEFNQPQVTPSEGAGEGQNTEGKNTEVQKDWRFWIPTHTDIRDDKVALFATYLPAGTYEYTFQVRATVPGEYRVLPAVGELMYFREVWGRSAGALFTVTK